VDSITNHGDVSQVATQGANIHLPYNVRINEYHRQAARLTLKYTTKTAGRVLDIGCGTGFVLDIIAKENSRLALFGADIDPQCLKLTKQKSNTINTIQLTEDEPLMALNGKTYDTIIMSHVLEHTEYPLKVLGDVMKLLEPGGHLVLLVPNPVRLDVVLFNLFRYHYVNRGHIHAWDRSHWMNFLERIAGLNVIEYASDDIKLFPWQIKERIKFLYAIERQLAVLIPWWSFSNIAVIRK